MLFESRKPSLVWLCLIFAFRLTQQSGREKSPKVALSLETLFPIVFGAVCAYHWPTWMLTFALSFFTYQTKDKAASRVLWPWSSWHFSREAGGSYEWEPRKHLWHDIVDFSCFFVRVNMHLLLKAEKKILGVPQNKTLKNLARRNDSSSRINVLTLASRAPSPPPSSPLHNALPWLLCPPLSHPGASFGRKSGPSCQGCHSLQQHTYKHRLSKAIISLEGHLPTA